jgi:putative FmdB family regulatory protein
MPTYRYRCEGCGDEFEVWQSITEDALSTHDASVTEGGCGAHVVKVLTPAGIVLKGSGFYKTDNRGGRSSSSNGDGAKDSSSKSDTATKSDSSSSKSKDSSSSSSGSGSGSGDSPGSGSSKSSTGSSSSSS